MVKTSGTIRVSRRAVLKTSVATGAALAAGSVFAPAVHAAKSIRIGNPREAGTAMGPLVSEAQMNRVLNYVDIGKHEGAQLAFGGKRVGHSGFFVSPTVFAGVEHEMRRALFCRSRQRAEYRHHCALSPTAQDTQQYLRARFSRLNYRNRLLRVRDIRTVERQQNIIWQ